MKSSSAFAVGRVSVARTTDLNGGLFSWWRGEEVRDGDRTNNNGRNLGHLPHIVVGLHDALYPRDGELCPDLNMLDVDQIVGPSAIPLLLWLASARGLLLDNGVGVVLAIVVVVLGLERGRHGVGAGGRAGGW
jgi:hypothetical protein